MNMNMNMNMTIMHMHMHMHMHMRMHWVFTWYARNGHGMVLHVRMAEPYPHAHSFQATRLCGAASAWGRLRRG